MIRDNKWVAKVQELDQVLLVALRAAAAQKKDVLDLPAPEQLPLDTSIEGDLDDDGDVTPLNVTAEEASPGPQQQSAARTVNDSQNTTSE